MISQVVITILMISMVMGMIMITMMGIITMMKTVIITPLIIVVISKQYFRQCRYRNNSKLPLND